MPQPARGYQDRHIDRYGGSITRVTSGVSALGKVTIPSGSVAVDVVYPGISSSDIFTSLIPVVSSISAISSRATFLAVSSIVPGTGFTIAWGNGVAYAADVVVHWSTAKTA